MSKETNVAEKVNKAAQDMCVGVTAPKIKPGDELVSYTVPLMPGETKRDIIVGVNGETIRIKRGETVMIKRKFLEALNNANKQQLAAYQSTVKAQEQSKKPMANL